MTDIPIVLTVDVEDYYMSPETIPFESWGEYEDRVEIGVRALLRLLADGQSHATFFFLGYVAERHPDLVKEVAAQGHEIGTHNYSHHPYTEAGPDRFRQGLLKSIAVLEGITGAKVIGHRAPMWSVLTEMHWVFEALVDSGLEYDSSIFPIRTYLYGDPGARACVHRIEAGKKRTILEIPPSTQALAGFRLPVAGGFFLRAYPLWLILRGIESARKRAEPVVLYVHPWELDPDHPRPVLPFKQRIIHSIGLRSVHRKLKVLLEHYRFASIRDTLSQFEALASNGD